MKVTFVLKLGDKTYETAKVFPNTTIDDLLTMSRSGGLQLPVRYVPMTFRIVESWAVASSADQLRLGVKFLDELHHTNPELVEVYQRDLERDSAWKELTEQEVRK